MRRFEKILEDCQHDMGIKEYGPGEQVVMDALANAGFKTSDSQNACFMFTDQSGRAYNVTVEAVGAEDEENETDQEIDDAAKQMKMADKATEDDPNTIQQKRSLTQQVGQTYGDLTQGLRKVTTQLKR